jgi:gamma-glutamyltranspeptidase/glutathione hydrolase
MVSGRAAAPLSAGKSIQSLTFKIAVEVHIMRPLLAVVLMSLSFSEFLESAAYAVGEEFRTRSPVIARNGIVATSQPLAAQAGLEVLKAGGNAIDAAIATDAVLGVVEPASCGIGGDLFAIVWDAKTQKLYGLNASGRSPYAHTRDLFKQRGLKQIPITGPLSWSVPGCVSGWEELRNRFGTKSYSDLLATAIKHAEEGFPVSPVIAGEWSGAENGFRRWSDSAKTFLIDGRAPRTGQIFSNPRLAQSYRLIAQHGVDAFYRGPIARQVVDWSEKNGGLITMKDFADHQSEWVDPVSTNYRGYDVWELPPNGQGIAVLQMLNVLEQHDVRRLGFGSADYLHLFLEAKKLAFADRAWHYFDPDFGKPPVERLISKEYARERGKLINMKRATTQVMHGELEMALRSADTIYLTVVDKDRNCCSLIQSNYFGFGSMVMPGEVGFAMQNRGTLFALDEKHPNRLEPHKRPFHTIIPAFVTKDGKPWFCFGVMGGDMQPQGHVQVLVNMIDFGMDPQLAGDAPRLRHDGSATPTGEPHAIDGGTVYADRGISEGAIQELRNRGHVVERGAAGGGYQGILIDSENGVLIGGSEPRKDGQAVGY